MAFSQTSRPGRGLILPNKRYDSDAEEDCKIDNDVISCTFKLLDEGEKEIKLDDKYKDVIMTLGNTGSGKSTFIQWLIGDNTKLISKETEEGTGEYIIEDNDKISNSTLDSKTTFPELFVDAKTNTGYYDCPGFSDTKGASHEIAETYFIKKVLDFLESLKMVFVVNYSSVRKGVDRQDFMTLLKHVTDLVKDIDKFKTSIGMVVTKVDNQYIKQGDNFILVEDDKVIAGIAGFLEDVIHSLEEDLKAPNISEKKKQFYENAIKFVMILLEKEGDNYPRIGIFRRPDMPGPVSDIPLLQNGKQPIEKIVYEKLDFTSKDNDDFGYTVSAVTKNDINDMVEEINNNLWSSLSSITEKIQKYCQDLVEQVDCKIQLFVNETHSVDADPSEAEIFRYKFISAYNSTSELINETSNLKNPTELAVIVNSTTSNLDIGISKDDILYIETQGNYFNFLQTISDKELHTRHWDQPFRNEEKLISEEETNILQDVRLAEEKINDRIQININDTVKGIQEEYTKQIKSLGIQKLSDKLNEDYGTIFGIIKEMKNRTTIDKLVTGTRNISDNLGVTTSEENLQNITNQGNYLKYLEVLSNETFNVDQTKWLSPYENFAEYVNQSEKWYTFLEDLYNKFSEYNIQTNRQRYNVADLADWGQPDRPQGISITANNFKEFLDKIENYNVAEYKTIRNMKTTTDLQIEELNQALSLTLKHSPTIKCLKSYIIVKDNFIVLKEIIQNLMSNSDTDNSCNNFRDQLEEQKFNLLKVFALNKVFIDDNLSIAGKGISVTVIAPEWEVVGLRSMDLSGADGTPNAEPKARNGTNPGSNGENGAPGNPGVSGESFFGIGATFVGGSKLQLYSNGGTGAQGQGGGDGATGAPGKDAPEPATFDEPCESGLFRDFKCDTVEVNKKKKDWTETTFRIHGLEGLRGGDGGDGGKGGVGGDSGNISVVELDRPSRITKCTSKGKEGDDGKAGIGGQGGKNGDDKTGVFVDGYEMHCTITCEKIHRLQWGIIQTQKNSTVGKAGNDGTNGGNAEGIKDPIPANGISSLPYIINAYKTYLRGNINNRFNRYSLLQFLEQINSSDEIRSLYDTLALIDEFQGLEEQFLKLNKDIDFSLFYNSLLDRISEFAESQNNDQNSSENKKVLNYLYTSILGRIENLKENSEQNLIIDMGNYLDMVKDNIKILKDMQMIDNKVYVVNKYKDNYKSGIDMKIKEAQSLIKKQIEPEIDNVNTEIDNEVNTLIEETKALEEKAEKDLQELEEEKKKLGNSMGIKGMFNCFKIIGGVVSFLGPTGAIAGTVISVTSNVGEALALQNEQKILNLPSDTVSSLNTLSNQIKMMRNQKITYLNKVLNDLSDEVEKNPDELGDMKDKISDIRNKLQKVSRNELDFQQVSILENELNEEIEAKADYLKMHSNDEKSVDALKAIQKLNKLIQFGSLFSNMYDEMSEDQGRIDIVNDAIEKKKDEIKKLREYEENIYEMIAPMLQEMEDHMKDISDKLGTESQVALDVTKWQVQSTLKDMKLQMQRLTEGFDVKDDLSRSIEKLSDVMTTLINLYDRIQSYQDQENLANYIADVSSVASSEINIQDQQLVNAVNHLEFVIRSNIVLEQYKSAFDAFQQWVFPFSDQYTEKVMLPSKLELDKNIEILVQNTVERIKAMKHKIDLYHASIMNVDQYLVCGEFNSRSSRSKPFLVWKNEDFGYEISNLLSGKEVILKADVKYSDSDKDAIKFREIDFYFKIKNETAQSQLSNTLKGFDITATHLGNSYYRYNDKISLITSDSVEIYYTIERNANGIPIHSNGVYDKLKRGDLLLSPYTLWEVRLSDKTDQYSFQDLEKFKNEIDIELSGLGCYVDRNLVKFSEKKSFTMRNNNILLLFKPEDTELSECKRSKYRSARSINKIAVDGDYMTNAASKVMSSPFNILCNFFKTYFVSNLVISINRVFYGAQTSESINYFELSEECNETRSNCSTVMTPITDTDAISSENDCINGRFVQKYIVSDVNFNDKNSCQKSFLLSDGKYRSDNKLTQVPDLNSSLLLADMVTRTIKGNRYKSPVDECLLSPRELILRKIKDGVVRNERDVKQILQRLLSEKKEERPSSMFSKLNGYAKSVLQVLGLVGNSEYVEDIRHLFA